MLPENPPISVRQIKRSKAISTPSASLNAPVSFNLPHIIVKYKCICILFLQNTPESLARAQATQGLTVVPRNLVNNQRLSNDANAEKVNFLYKRSP